MFLILGDQLFPQKYLQKYKKDFFYIAEDIGLFKFDILSQRGLGKIRDTLGLISSHSPEIVAALDIHDMQRFKTDPKVQNLLRKALATGCFYVESLSLIHI